MASMLHLQYDLAPTDTLEFIGQSIGVAIIIFIPFLILVSILTRGQQDEE